MSVSLSLQTKFKSSLFVFYLIIQCVISKNHIYRFVLLNLFHSTRNLKKNWYATKKNGSVIKFEADILNVP